MIITIYVREKCYFCNLAKELIKKLEKKFDNLKYKYIDIKQMSLKELSKKIDKKVQTVPQIIFDNKYIGGYEDFLNYCKLKKLI